MNDAGDKNLELKLRAAYEEHKRGDVESACAVYEEVLRTTPDHPVALHYLALARFQTGRREEAFKLLRESLAIAPARAAAHADMGRFLGLTDNDEGAVRCFKKALELDDQRADTWHNLGVVFQDGAQTEEAFAAFKRTLRIDPARADTLFALAKLLFGEGQTADGRRALELAVKTDPSDVKPRVLLAQHLADEGQTNEALRQFKDILKHTNDVADAWVGYGQTNEDLGHADEAERAYARALQLDRGNGVAIGRMLILKGADAPDGLPELAAQALERADVPEEARALVGYGLGKARERAGDFHGAFAAYRAANEARRRTAGAFDRDAFKARIDALTEAIPAGAFDDPPLPARPDREENSETGKMAEPVFIVGMPRSGTTLTEQILASHPAIWGAGELPGVADAASALERAVAQNGSSDDVPCAPGPGRLFTGDRSRVSRLLSDAARAYLGQLRAGAAPENTYAVDKAPLNFFHLWLIALLFPDARVIHCRRDPRDVCLSIYAENFAPSQKHATDLEDLAFYWRGYRRLMDHWEACLPLKILHADYHETVGDLEASARRLCAFLELPWDDRCLAFHETDRAVRTPSRWQVRQPLYSSSLARWRRFEKDLTPLINALGPAIGETIRQGDA